MDESDLLKRIRELLRHQYDFAEKERNAQLNQRDEHQLRAIQSELDGTWAELWRLRRRADARRRRAKE